MASLEFYVLKINAFSTLSIALYKSMRLSRKGGKKMRSNRVFESNIKTLGNALINDTLKSK